MSITSLFRKKEETTSQQDQPATPPPMNPNDVEKANAELQQKNKDATDSQTGNNSQSDDIPELPPLDLPDLDDNTSSDEQEKTSTQGEGPQIDNDASELPSLDDDEIPSSSTNDDAKELPSFDDDEKIEEANKADSDSLPSIQTTDSEESYEPQFIDFSKPIFIEQHLYHRTLKELELTKEEIVQIQKFSGLLQDLNEHIENRYTNYQKLLSQMQSGITQMEQKLFGKRF
ncbi:MAG: hypothetical protein ACMXYA_01950 [Candidatus Woesearchaeota archaeon]